MEEAAAFIKVDLPCQAGLRQPQSALGPAWEGKSGATPPQPRRRNEGSLRAAHVSKIARCRPKAWQAAAPVPPHRRLGMLGAVQVILALSHLRPTTRLHWRSSAPKTLRTSPDSRVIGRGSSSVLAAPLSAQHTRPTARRQPPRRRPGVLGAVQSILALGHLRPITRLH